MADIKPWPNAAGRPELPPPRELHRPADWGLKLAITNLETQLGTIEAYNRLARAAQALHARIEAGDAKAQNPLFAVSLTGDPAEWDQNRRATPGVSACAPTVPDAAQQGEKQ